MTTNLCSSADLSAFTKIKTGFTAMDPMIAQVIAAASSEVRNFCRRQFDKKVRVEYFPTMERWSGDPLKVFLTERNVDTVQTFAVDLDYTARFRVNEFTTLMVTEDYLVDAERGSLDIFYSMYDSRRGLRITYTAGYDVVDNVLQVPDEVKTATAMQASFLLRRGYTAGLGRIEERSEGTNRAVYDPSQLRTLVPEVQAMLSNYRRAMVGRS